MLHAYCEFPLLTMLQRYNLQLLDDVPEVVLVLLHST